MLSRIVSRMHITETDRRVVEYVVSRMKPGAFDALSTTARGDIAHEAISHHRDNQRLYAFVMRGGR